MNRRPRSARTLGIRFTLPGDEEKRNPELMQVLGQISDQKVEKNKKRQLTHRACSAPDMSTKVSKLEDSDDKSKLGAYLIGGVLGQGTQGTVCKALDTNTGTFVAIKEIRVCDDKQMASVTKEIELLHQLDHPNIVKYIATLHRSQYIFIIFEFIENGSLYDILLNFGVFTESLAAIYIKQVLKGLVYLHQKNIVHRDIKGANILITKDGTCKLGDFGLATTVSRLSIKNLAVGTSYWMAPEFISGSVEEVTASSDIWSLGATVVELVTGHPPLHELGPMVAAFQLIEGEAIPIPEGVSVELHSFLSACFHLDPTERPTAKQLLLHPWVAGESSSTFNDLTSALKNNQLHRHRARRGVIRPRKAKQLPQDRPANKKPSSLLQLTEDLDSFPDPEVDSLEYSDLQQQFISLREKTKDITKRAKEMEEEIRNLKNARDQPMPSAWIEAGESRARLQQTNQHLREQIQFLEQNMNISDKERALMIFGEINWGNFDVDTRGVLKIAKKNNEKLKKRHVVLQDNFFFIYAVDATDVDDPIDVIWLVDVSVSPVSDLKYPCNSFDLKTTNRHIVICAASSGIMEKWMKRFSFTKSWFDVEEFTRLRSPRAVCNKSDRDSGSILSAARKKIRHAL